MQIENYNGNTWVAYLDISGFKAMMKDKKKALNVLDHFYEHGYHALRDHNQRVQGGLESIKINGFLISDCGLLFLRLGNDQADNPLNYLQPLLNMISRLSREMIEHNVMISTSIAFGHFRYEGRLELKVVEKTMVYGNAYVSAYLDNEVNEPRLKPGHCRIILDGLEPFASQVNQHLAAVPERRMRHQGHLMYYWMVEREEDIKGFQEKFEKLDSRDWDGMRDLINKHAIRPRPRDRGTEAENGNTVLVTDDEATARDRRQV